MDTVIYKAVMLLYIKASSQSKALPHQPSCAYICMSIAPWNQQIFYIYINTLITEQEENRSKMFIKKSTVQKYKYVE